MVMMENQKTKNPFFVYQRIQMKREEWINDIPRDNIPDTGHSIVCERHWEPGYETIYKNVVKWPKYEPNVFSCVKQSLVPTKQPPARSTKRTSSEMKNIIPDELEEFLFCEKISNFEVLCRKLCDNDTVYLFRFK